MKFCKVTILLFSLFLLPYAQVYATALSDVKHTIKYIISNPMQATITCAKIGSKGFVTLYSGYLACCKGKKLFRYFTGDDFDLEPKTMKKPLKAALMGLGLSMIVIECGNSLIDDIKKLK